MPNIRRYLLTGLAAIIPVVVTLYILNLLFSFLRLRIGTPVERYLTAHVEWIGPAHSVVAVVVGLLLTLGFLVLIGFTASTVVGRRLVSLGERIVERVPLVGSIYGPARQLVKLVFSADPDQLAFRRVVLIPYPHRGLYSVGFLTADQSGQPSERTGTDLVNVFVPTSPSPITGFLVLVPRSMVIELDYTIEQGMKLVISAGVLIPESTNHDALEETDGKAVEGPTERRPEGPVRPGQG